MDTRDPAGEFLRITERYRQMSDSELLVLLPQSSELTPLAQQALASEVRTRGLKLEVEEEAPSAPARFKAPPAFFEQEPPENGEADDSDPDPDLYDEDRRLVELCTVWSARDAVKVQGILDAAGIPFFMGREKATSVDGVTSNYANGVSVQIMKIGMQWAAPGMSHYEPEDDPTPKEVEEPEELVVRCPQCRSTEVVFEGGTSSLVVAADDPSQKYRWSCEACGNEWEDDGVAAEE